MNSQYEREKIRKINLIKVYFSEEKGIPVDNGIMVNIPDFSQLKNDAFKQIIEKGFQKVEQVSPNEANCIIRVFKKEHFEYNNADEVHNLYGFNCFTKESNNWISINCFTKESNNWISISTQAKMFEIDFSKCIHRMWICPDEYIDYVCDFFDCYVKVS